MPRQRPEPTEAERLSVFHKDKTYLLTAKYRDANPWASSPEWRRDWVVSKVIMEPGRRTQYLHWGISFGAHANWFDRGSIARYLVKAVRRYEREVLDA